MLTQLDRISLSDTILSEAISRCSESLGRPLLVSISGSQGSGKSSTAKRLVCRLGAAGLRSVAVSLDDFYITKEERERLGTEVHPLFATRGPPGTHDLQLLTSVIEKLLGVQQCSSVLIPKFEKLSDDRAPESAWSCHKGVVDIVLLEGWCLGARPEQGDSLAIPINHLEAREDTACIWRRRVNEYLSASYAELFQRFDFSILLKAPSFDCVLRWRTEQESSLSETSKSGLRIMDEGAMRRFIAHYERLTRRLLIDEPANLIVELDFERAAAGWRLKSTTSPSGSYM